MVAQHVVVVVKEEVVVEEEEEEVELTRREQSGKSSQCLEEKGAGRDTTRRATAPTGRTVSKEAAEAHAQ